jgi:hypothetical protein
MSSSRPVDPPQRNVGKSFGRVCTSAAMRHEIPATAVATLLQLMVQARGWTDWRPELPRSSPVGANSCAQSPCAIKLCPIILPAKREGPLAPVKFGHSVGRSGVLAGPRMRTFSSGTASLPESS